MITPYMPVEWQRIAYQPVRRVDPVEALSSIGPSLLPDLADQAPLPRPRQDSVEISDQALRLLAAYEQDKPQRNTP